MYLQTTSPAFFPQFPIGLGDMSTAEGAVSAGGSALAVGAAVGTPALLSAGLITSAAVPFIGPAIAAVTLLIGILVKNSGCGITCVETSQWANQAEPLLAQNIQEYFNVPAPRAASLQATALANFDRIWSTLVQQCSQSGTGDAGKRCISDRQSGACTWKQTATSPLLSYPGEPQPGACWNWFSGYRDPIAHDANVVPDATLLASSASGAASDVGSALSSALGSNTGLLLLGAGALIFLGVAMK